MPTTAAISAGIGALGSLGSAFIGSNAAQTASSQQVAEQQQALALQKQMFGTATNALNPFINAGQSVLPTLQSLLTPGASQTNVLSQTPGFQFNSQYGTMAATNALAAKTGPSAGPLATAISQYNQGLAGTTWQNVVNSLQNYAGLGSGAAGALTGAAITSGNSQAGTLTNTGNALAAGTLGSANALTGGITGTTNALSSAAIYNALLGNGGAGLYAGAGGKGGSVSDGS